MGNCTGAGLKNCMGTVENCIAAGAGLGIGKCLGVSLNAGLSSCGGASLGAGLGGVETI